MKKIINIPFFSQLDQQIPEDIRRSVCAIACIKMVIDYKKEKKDFSKILKEAEYIGQKDKAGWTHEVLVRILRNYNVLAYRQEFIAHNIDLDNQSANVADHTNEFVEKGIEKIKKNIDNQNPVMVSVKAGFSENKSDHMVLIIGYEKDSLIIFDPILNIDKNPLLVSVKNFKDFWKNLAIFVE